MPRIDNPYSQTTEKLQKTKTYYTFTQTQNTIIMTPPTPTPNPKQIKKMKKMFNEQGYAYFFNFLHHDDLKQLQKECKEWIDTHQPDPTPGNVCYEHYIQTPTSLQKLFDSEPVRTIISQVTGQHDLKVIFRNHTKDHQYKANEFSDKINVYRSPCEFSPHVDRRTCKGNTQIAIVFTINSEHGEPFHIRLYGNNSIGLVKQPSYAIPLHANTLTIHKNSVFHDVQPPRTHTTVRTAYLTQMSNNTEPLKGIPWAASFIAAGARIVSHATRTKIQGRR